MNQRMNLITKLTMIMAGTYKKVATSRLIKFSTRDKKLFNKSITELSK